MEFLCKLSDETVIKRDFPKIINLYPNWDGFPNVVRLRHHRQIEHEHWNQKVDTVV